MQELYEYLVVKIFEDRPSMGAAAAKAVAEKVNELLNVQEFVNVIFASAPSQNEFLEELTRKDVDWRRVNAFHMDEYIELPENHPATFKHFLWQKLFSKINLHSINYINGNAPSIGEECRRYAALLAEYPADLVCLGIGENGHLAFNDPPVADFNDAALVKMVRLDGDCRQQQVNDGCFANLADVPGYAITLTIPALMHGRFIYGIVPGKQKQQAVYNTLTQKIDEQYPASVLRRHPNATLFLDNAAAGLLE
jgi:glucosamine-6-phosphate deaminase